jgi:FdhE protein
VAGRFLRKLLGRSAPPSAEVAEALAELERLKQDRPTLGEPIALLADVLPILFEEPPTETPPALTTEHASAKLAGKVPLLRGETFSVEEAAFRRRWLAICAKVPHGGKELAEALRRGRLSPTELVQTLLAGRPEAIQAQAEALGLDVELTATVLRLTLFPVLARVSEMVAPLREGTRWERGYCPACGSWPLLGEYRGLEQTRFLRCGWCAAEWEFPRLLCPFCGIRDHQLLGYFHPEGEELKHRATTCDSCRGYVKMLTTLTALSGPRLLVADLATMHLDLAAAERNYQ